MSVQQQFLKYLPAVLGGVLTAEMSIADKTGKTKKQVVLNTIKNTADFAGQAIDSPTLFKISALIDSIVTAFNASSVFTHELKDPIPAPPKEPADAKPENKT